MRSVAVPPPVGSRLAPSAPAGCVCRWVAGPEGPGRGEAPAVLSLCRWERTDRQQAGSRAGRLSFWPRALMMPRHLGGGRVEEAAVAATTRAPQRWEGRAAGGDAALGGRDAKDDGL